MRRFLLLSCLSFLFPSVASAQRSNDASDVFAPIAKYLSKGDVECLSAWFSDNLEIDMPDHSGSYSRRQACKVMESFFADYTPRCFQIVHKSDSYPLICAVGKLEGGGQAFVVTILVRTTDDGNTIQQIKIEKK